MPVVTISDPYTPSTYNDPELSARMAAAMKAELGDERVMETPPVMGGEDFSQFWRMGDMPTMIFWIGAVDPATWQAAQNGGEPLPSLHSPFFAPVAEPTITTGVTAMTAAVLDLMGK